MKLWKHQHFVFLFQTWEYTMDKNLLIKFTLNPARKEIIWQNISGMVGDVYLFDYKYCYN